MDTNLNDVRKHVAMLADDALLAVERDDLTSEALAVYDAEVTRRGLAWPPVVAADGEVLPGISLEPGTKLTPIVSYESADEARFARDLLRHEQIPAWLAGELTQLKVEHEFENPLDLLVPSNLIEQAELLLNSPIDDEELARQAEAAGTGAVEDEV